MTISYFNSFQRDHMQELAKIPLEEKCWCGWNRFGKCPNNPPICYPGKTCADKVKETKNEC